MDRRDQELLDKQMRRVTPRQNDGAIAVMLAAMFLMASPSAAFCLRTKVSRYKSRRLVHEARSNCLRLFAHEFHRATRALTLCLINWVRQGERSNAPFILGPSVSSRTT